MAIFNFLSENIILPLGDLATGQSVAKHLKFLLQSQSWSANEIREFQEQRLKKIIRHSVEQFHIIVNYLITMVLELKM